MTISQLANEFNVKENIITRLENQKISLDEKMCNKYLEKFNITKEYFFDLDLETLILSGEGHIIKSFDNSKDCLKEFNEIMELYKNAVESNEKYITIDFATSQIW